MNRQCGLERQKELFRQMDRQPIMDADNFSDKGIKRCLEKYFYNSANPSISICNQKGGVGKSIFTDCLPAVGSVPIVDYGYWKEHCKAAARWVASGAQKATFSPAKRRGWKFARLALGRFAWPCGFSFPAINSLPAERDYGDIRNIRYSGIAPAYCATLKTLSSFSLNAAISRPILSLVILA